MFRGTLRPTVIALTLLALSAAPTFAAKPVGPKLQVKPGTFVGTAVGCAPGEAGTPGGVRAAWRTHRGLPDAGRSDHALVLTKSVATTDCSSAFARIRGVNGQPAQTLGFDYREDSLCTGGSARFNVLTSDGVFHFVGGCGNGTPAVAGTDRRGNDWFRVEFDLDDPAVAFPPVADDVTLVSVSVFHDEQGTSILDNISVNGKRIGKPGRR